ncbi:MAG: dihydropteroate synthase [Actinomycetota bacterium]
MPDGSTFSLAMVAAIPQSGQGAAPVLCPVADAVLPCAHGKHLVLGRRTLVMGILNVTPDSFSDGGRFTGLDAAIAHADRLVAEGADILDIGAESTRPGNEPVSQEEEQRRLLPVIARIAARYPHLLISVDTYKARVAELAIAAGAAIINDVWAFRRDPAMANVAAKTGAGVVVMHHCADPTSGDIHAGKNTSLDILDHAENLFEEVLARASNAGVRRESLILDPGIGFGKTQEQNLRMIASLDWLRSCFGLPILLGASRKSFIGVIAGSSPDQRLPGSLAAHLLGILAGAQIVRVHDVAATVQAVKLAEAIMAAGNDSREAATLALERSGAGSTWCDH